MGSPCVLGFVEGRGTGGIANPWFLFDRSKGSIPHFRQVHEREMN